MSFREGWGSSNLHTVLCSGRNRPVFVYNCHSSGHLMGLIATFCFTPWCHSFQTQYLALFSSMWMYPPWPCADKSSWGQICRDGRGELGGEPRRAGERGRITEHVAAQCAGWALRQAPDGKKAVLNKRGLEQPIGRGRCIKRCTK